MLVFPGRRSQPVSIASSRTSRSNSRVSQRSEEKIVVFKDEVGSIIPTLLVSYWAA